MKLRERLLVTLVVIAGILITPALVGLYSLTQLRNVAQQIQARDAVGALTLGRLQAAVERVEALETNYVAVANLSDEAGRRPILQEIATESSRVEAELRQLTSGGYAEAARPVLERWRRVERAVTQEHRLVESGAVDAADAHRTREVVPAFEAMDSALTPLGQAINEKGEEQVAQARRIAESARTYSYIALAAALVLALVVGGWLIRSMLQPIHRLRRAMSEVAGGDLEPELPIPPTRPDELGDLANSFRRMTAQLAELDRLKAEFVSVASHELKTPLSVIKGYVSLLQDGIYGEVAPEQRKVLTAVSDQADRLGRLIQQLLDISRFEAGGGRLEIRPIDLRAFLTDLVVSFEALAVQNDIDFQLETAPGLPDSFAGDPDRLNEVVGNLLSNAFKFTQRRGRIRLRVFPCPEGVGIEVADTGVGIPADQVDKVFDKFYQVDNDAQPRSVGSGLGLSISREIVEAHGGTISAESQLGKGTTFRVTLPLEPSVREAA